MSDEKPKKKSLKSIYHYTINEGKIAKADMKRRAERKRVNKIFTPSFYSNKNSEDEISNAYYS